LLLVRTVAPPPPRTLQVPPSQWAAAIALEEIAKDVLTNLVGSLRDAAINLWRQRPVMVTLSIAGALA
jgi:hypothetical protein